MRVAIYARVSTNGKNGNGDEQSRRQHRQDTDNQLFQLREWCAKAGHEIVEEYVEQISGGAGKGRNGYRAAHQAGDDAGIVMGLPTPRPAAMPSSHSFRPMPMSKPISDAKNGASETDGKLKRKDYE